MNAEPQRQLLSKELGERPPSRFQVRRRALFGGARDDATHAHAREGGEHDDGERTHDHFFDPSVNIDDSP